MLVEPVVVLPTKYGFLFFLMWTVVVEPNRVLGFSIKTCTTHNLVREWIESQGFCGLEDVHHLTIAHPPTFLGRPRCQAWPHAKSGLAAMKMDEFWRSPCCPQKPAPKHPTISELRLECLQFPAPKWAIAKVSLVSNHW